MVAPVTVAASNRKQELAGVRDSCPGICITSQNVMLTGPCPAQAQRVGSIDTLQAQALRTEEGRHTERTAPVLPSL